jgi:hypothetical protein
MNRTPEESLKIKAKHGIIIKFVKENKVPEQGDSDEVKDAWNHYLTCNIINCESCLMARMVEIKDIAPPGFHNRFQRVYNHYTEGMRMLKLELEKHSKIDKNVYPEEYLKSTNTLSYLRVSASAAKTNFRHIMADVMKIWRNNRFPKLESSPSPKMQKESDMILECPICLEPYKNNRRVFGCGHICCKNCADRLLSNPMATCYLCRTFIAASIPLYMDDDEENEENE